MEKSRQRGREKHLHRGGEGGNGFNAVLRHALLGVCVFLGAVLIFCATGAGLCLLSPDPAALTLPTGIGIFFLSAIAAGGVSGYRLKGDKTAALFSGLLCGFSIMVFSGVGAMVQNLLSAQSTHNIGVLTECLVRGLAIPISGFCAYFTATQKKRGRHRRR